MSSFSSHLCFLVVYIGVTIPLGYISGVLRGNCKIATWLSLSGKLLASPRTVPKPVTKKGLWRSVGSLHASSQA